MGSPYSGEELHAMSSAESYTSRVMGMKWKIRDSERAENGLRVPRSPTNLTPGQPPAVGNMVQEHGLNIAPKGATKDQAHDKNIYLETARAMYSNEVPVREYPDHNAPSLDDAQALFPEDSNPDTSLDSYLCDDGVEIIEEVITVEA